MSVVGRSDVHKVARLARLALTEAELATFVTQLDEILTYVQQLHAIPTDGIEPTSHAITLTNVVRADQRVPSLPAQEVVQLAPASHGSCVRVPKVIDL